MGRQTVGGEQSHMGLQSNNVPPTVLSTTGTLLCAEEGDGAVGGGWGGVMTISG